MTLYIFFYFFFYLRYKSAQRAHYPTNYICGVRMKQFVQSFYIRGRLKKVYKTQDLLKLREKSTLVILYLRNK